MKVSILLSLSILIIQFVTLTTHADERLGLASFLKKVSEQNLDIKIESAKLDSTRAAAIGINIPPPMISINEMSPDSGRGGKGFEINQTIPFPTKLIGDSSARKYEAQAQSEFQKARRKEILAQAKFLYISLWVTQEKSKLLDEKRKVLNEHIKLSRSIARSDSLAKIHLLKAESDLDFLENESEVAAQNLREMQSQIAVFLNLNPEITKFILEEAPLSEVPKIGAVETSSQIQAMKFKVEGFKARELEAKSAWLPDFNLRYKKVEETVMGPANNEVMVGITLPFVFFWEPYSASSKAIADTAGAAFELEKAKRNFESDKINLQSRSESLKKQILALKEKLIPRAEIRMKLVHNIAPRDMESLQDHRETMEAFPELKMKALDLRMEYEQAISVLEKYGEGRN